MHDAERLVCKCLSSRALRCAAVMWRRGGYVTRWR